MERNFVNNLEGILQSVLEGRYDYNWVDVSL
jgi:hypothetical protein